MVYPLTSTRKSAMAFAASRPWLQAACGLLLCLACGAAGAQATAFMDAALNGQSLLPLEDPYCSPSPPAFLGSNPQSTDLCTPVAVPSIATATAFTASDGATRYRGAVDWVLVELRDTAGDANSAVGSTVIARKPGFLLSNGRVVEAVAWQAASPENRNSCLAFGAGASLETSSTCPDLHFEGIAVSDNLYIVVRHRNHLDIISADAVAATGNVRIYDFSNSASAALNSGQKVIFGQRSRARRVGVAMMLAGDVSHRNQSHNLVRFDTDYNDIVIGQSGYLESDVNLDGVVNPVDDLLDVLSSNLGVGTQVPE